MTAARLDDISSASAWALECRDEGHRWDFVTDRLVRAADGTLIQFVQVRRCDRCGTERDRVIALPSLAVRGTRYRYPANYLVRRLPGTRVQPVDVRRVRMHRLGIL